MSRISGDEARALGALLVLGAFNGRFAMAAEVAEALGAGSGREWAPKLRHLILAGLVESDGAGGYTVARGALPSIQEEGSRGVARYARSERR